MARLCRSRFLLALLLSAGTPGGAAAGEPGQIEINQARALAGGVTIGDAPGFPVSIRQPGSYRLTGDLLVEGASAPSTDGIRIEASGVTLDLAGFTLRCERPGIPLRLPCAGAGGSGDGVDVAGVKDVRVENGTVTSFARHGLLLAAGAEGFQLHDLRIHGNGQIGVFSSGIGRIDSSVLMQNGSWGIWSLAGSITIRDSLTDDNGSGGLTRSSAAEAPAARSVFADGVNNVAAGDLLGCVLMGTTRVCP